MRNPPMPSGPLKRKSRSSSTCFHVKLPLQPSLPALSAIRPWSCHSESASKASRRLAHVPDGVGAGACVVAQPPRNSRRKRKPSIARRYACTRSVGEALDHIAQDLVARVPHEGLFPHVACAFGISRYPEHLTEVRGNLGVGHHP